MFDFYSYNVIIMTVKSSSKTDWVLAAPFVLPNIGRREGVVITRAYTDRATDVLIERR